jgi:hypothetical protein
MDSINILSSAVNKVGRLAFVGGVVLLALAGAVGAQVGPAAPASAVPALNIKPAAPVTLVKPLWATLTPVQKTALEPLAAEWDRMDATRKQKWLEIANRFAAMKPDEQARVHEKMREWVKMTPDERRVVRENFTKAKKLDVTQKSAQWEKYQQLPEEQKQQLAAEAAKSKKQVTNLPAAQASIKTVAPIKHTPVPCPAGTVARAGASAQPACVAVPAGVANVPPGATPPPAATSAIPAAAPVNAK